MPRSQDTHEKHRKAKSNLVCKAPIIINNLWDSYRLLSPNEIAPLMIGIHSYLLRPNTNKHFSKFYQGNLIAGPIEDFCNIAIERLQESINLAKQDDSQPEIERCIISARLIQYLEEMRGSFPDLLKNIQNFVVQRMCDTIQLPACTTEFEHRCEHQNVTAFHLQQLYRKQRFQCDPDYIAQSSINIINVQTQLLSNLHIFLRIRTQGQYSCEITNSFRRLLDNSFLIIQEPLPPVATQSPEDKKNFTAKLNCSIACLLDPNDSPIIIDDIIPRVRRITSANPFDETVYTYEQSKLEWCIHTIITSTQNQRRLRIADLTEICLKSTAANRNDGKSSSDKCHYSPYVYCIDFVINVRVQIAGKPDFQHSVIVQSAPFGLITNTKQSNDLFAKVFIQDLANWKQISTQENLKNVDNFSVSPVKITIEDIIDGIRGYFIQKTGIKPKPWVMPYISKLLNSACENSTESVETVCHNILVKIIAQIDFMVEHPMLSLLHADGPFLGICNSNDVELILQKEGKNHDKPICSIRFGELTRMTDSKNIGIRVDVIERASQNILHFKFDPKKISCGIGSFIIKIISCNGSYMCKVLSDLDVDFSNHTEDIRIFQLYDSAKLRELCPDIEKYLPLSLYTYSQERQHLSELSPTTTIPGITPIESTIQDEFDFNGFEPNLPSTNPFASEDQNLPLSSIEQLIDDSNWDTVQQSNSADVDQTPNQPHPLVIVITHQSNRPLSNEEVKATLTTQLPNYFPSLYSSFCRIDLNSMPPPITPETTLQATNFDLATLAEYEDIFGLIQNNSTQ